MSRFLILSENGAALGLALRLKKEGHEESLWIRDLESKDVGHDLVKDASKYRFGCCVIADCTNFGSILDVFRDSGIRTFAGASFMDRLENDRMFGQEVFRGAEIEVPESKEATNWEDAAKLISEIGNKSEKVVLKPGGQLSGVVPSYVASDAEDALKALEQFKSVFSGSDIELTIQEFIEGIAISTEGWFNGHDWVEGMFNHTLERKQTLDGDLGPSAGCAGNVVWRCDSSDPLVKRLLLNLTGLLREHVYRGPIDVNSIVNKEGVYGLEFTPRFGYDAFPTLLYSLCDFDFGSFVDFCSCGDLLDVSLNEGFGAGIRLCLPKDEKHAGEKEISGLSDEDFRWFYPYSVQSTKEGLKTTKGNRGPGVINGFGRSIGWAFAQAYNVCSRLKIQDVSYRTDLTEVFLKDYRELQSLEEESEGWLGVDLDGTLAKYSGWSENIGEPIPDMVRRVKRWIAEGKEVRVLTARGSDGSLMERTSQLMRVYSWIEENIGSSLEVTDKKDPKMLRLYDDRVVQVVANEGELVR